VNYKDCCYCGGSGRDHRVPIIECPVCGGTGRLPAFPKEQEFECKFCHGSGIDPSEYPPIPCRICKGHGVLYEGPIELIYISGGKPYSDHRTIENILERLTGEVRICETYFGKGTLDLLRSVPNNCVVRVLVVNITDISLKDVKRFNDERKGIEFRQFTRGTLHDRYIVDDTGLLILGHGLKDIGKRESFVIRLEKSLFPDIYTDISTIYDERWNQATIFPPT
jgi:hypothetical protein